MEDHKILSLWFLCVILIAKVSLVVCFACCQMWNVLVLLPYRSMNWNKLKHDRHGELGRYFETRLCLQWFWFVVNLEHHWIKNWMEPSSTSQSVRISVTFYESSELLMCSQEDQKTNFGEVGKIFLWWLYFCCFSYRWNSPAVCDFVFLLQLVLSVLPSPSLSQGVRHTQASDTHCCVGCSTLYPRVPGSHHTFSQILFTTQHNYTPTLA